MGALVCDICGGKLVMGSGGIAVCDSCGMEYSKERVKEKVQEIKGVVQIDNSNMVASWMKMGEDAASAGNQKEAYDYFAKVIEVEPRNWRAIFGKGKAAAWQSSLANLRISELYQAVQQANEIVDSLELDDKEKSDIKNEFAVAVYNVNNAITDLMEENLSKRDDLYFDSNWDDMWDTRQRALTNIDKIEDVMTLLEGLNDDLTKSNIVEMKKRICRDLIYACGYWVYWNDYSKELRGTFGFSAKEKKKYVDKFWELVAEIRETTPDFASTKYNQIDPFDPPASSYDFKRADKIFEHWKNIDAELKRKKEQAAAKKRFEEYWEAHADEKKKFEERLSEIASEKSELTTQTSEYDECIKTVQDTQSKQTQEAEKELSELKDQIRDFERQRSNLGLFAGKQKKELQAKIDALNATIPNIEEKVNRAKAAIKADADAKIAQIKAEKKPYSDKLMALQQEEQSINTELKKER